MKWYISKYKLLCCFAFCCFFSTASFAQQEEVVTDKEIRLRSRWSKLVPQYGKVQYAGSMGLMSIGTGWAYGKNKQWETDVFLGYLPKYSTKTAKATFTVKQNFIPWRKNINQHFYIEPLACGMYVNSILNSDFWTSEPEKYPNSYYSFSTKMRFNLYVGQRFACNLSGKMRKHAKSVTFFYEISSNELYIVSAISNSYLKPKDYIHLSLGLKLQIL